MKISFLVLLFVLYHQTIVSEGAIADTLVTETCSKAAQSNPSLNYDFCVKSLQTAPKSATADLHWLGIITTSLAKAKAAYGEAKIDSLLAKSQDPYDMARLNDCKELYTNALSLTKQAKFAFKTNNWDDANVHMGNALNSAVTCEDSWKEDPGHASLLSRENFDLQQLCRIGLAISKFLPSTT
ncbi:putative invertase inhibitor [Aristolochia californica]|uniref:putative invertase inhibitor n=1 Tax=Aristolochia californica TaxID=171875 RepID=UPI0035DA6922